MVNGPVEPLVIIDAFLEDPVSYRVACLAQTFGSVALGADTFHGIATPPSDVVLRLMKRRHPWADPRLTFLRQSPAGQVEPNDLHDDHLMGAWTGILYLNPDPPDGDGTIVDGQLVAARFNRLLIFPAALPHRRGIFANYGETPATARLIQVVFGGDPT